MSSTPLTTTSISPTGTLSFDSVDGHIQHYPSDGGRGVSPSPPASRPPVPSIHATEKTTLGDVAQHVINLPSDPQGELGNAWNALRKHLDAQTDHPYQAEIGKKMDDIQELLFGGQSVGKPMGTSGGVADVAAALSLAEDAPEMAEGAVNLARKGLSGLAETGGEIASGLKEE